GIAVNNKNDRIYVPNTVRSTLTVLNPDGTHNMTISRDMGRFQNPRDVAINETRNRIYVLNNFTVSVLNIDGSFYVLIPQSDCRFTNPKGIAVDKADGKIYITNYDTSTVTVLNPDGTFYGLIPGRVGMFLNPLGIHIDEDKNLYVVNESDDSISKLKITDNIFWKEWPVALPEPLEKRLAKKPLLRELVELLFILEDAPGAREFILEEYKKVMKEIKKLPQADKSPGSIVITPKLGEEDYLKSGLIRINGFKEKGFISCDAFLLNPDKNKLIILNGIEKMYRLLITAEEFDQIRRNVEQARIPVSSPLDSNMINWSSSSLSDDEPLRLALNEIYRKFILSVPFNSFSEAMWAMGIPTPETLGGNCIYQAKLLADKIRQERKGIDVNYCNDGIHYNVLVKSPSGKIFYLDPYLMHSEVIVIPESSGREGIEAYPYQYGKVSVVSFERKDTKFLVEKFEALAGGYGRVGKYTYNFDALKTDNDLPSLADETIAFNYQKTSLYMRILLENKQALGYSYNINSERAYINDYDHNDVDIENKQEFEALLSIILDTLKIGRGDFMRYIDDGIRAYILLLGRGNSRIGNSSPVFEGQCGGDTQRLEEILRNYKKSVRRPENVEKVISQGGFRLFECVIELVKVCYPEFVIGVKLPESVGQRMDALGIKRDAHFPGYFAFAYCQAEDLTNNQKSIVIMDIQSNIFSRLNERAKEGNSEMVEIRGCYQDWAKLLVVSLEDVGRIIGAKKIFIPNAVTASKRLAHNWALCVPTKLLQYLYEDLPQKMGYTPWKGMGYFDGDGLVFNIDIPMNSGWVKELSEELTPRDKAFLKYSSSPLQSLDSQYKKAEAIATYYVREIYGFMMQILLLGKKRVKISRQIVGLDERISKARKDSSREKYRQEKIQAEQKLRDVYSKIDALAADANEEIENFIIPKKLTSEDYPDASVGTEKSRSGFRPEWAERKGTQGFNPGGLHFSRAKEHLANFLSVLKQEDAYNESAAFLAGVAAINDLIAALTELTASRLKRPRKRAYFRQTKTGYAVLWGAHKKYYISDKKSVPMRRAVWHSFDTLWEAAQAVDRQFDNQLNEREWLVEAVESINAMRETFKKDTISQKDLSDIGDTIAGMLRKNKNAPIVTKKSIYRMALQAAREALAIDTKAADDALYICRKFMQARIKDIDDMMKRTEEGRLFHIRENVAQRNENISELLTQAIPIINARGELTQRQIDAVRRIIDTLLTDFQIAPFIRKEPDFYPLAERLSKFQEQGFSRKKARKLLFTLQLRVEAAKRLSECRIDFRKAYTQARLERKPQGCKQEVLNQSFLEFAKKNNLTRGSPRSALSSFPYFLTKALLPVFVSLRLPSPEDKSKKISNPVFYSLLDYSRLQEIGKIDVILNSLRLSKGKYPRLFAVVEAIAQKGITHFNLISQEERMAAAKALAEKYELASEQVNELVKWITYDVDEAVSSSIVARDFDESKAIDEAYLAEYTLGYLEPLVAIIAKKIIERDFKAIAEAAKAIVA
ncbi:MAG TPA: hypothetical protein DCL49_14600, partial [Candidatus Omnitrophica bacterium]|nr:hypothetical protein [Candidatus Omnitrophota bacterium]